MSLEGQRLGEFEILERLGQGAMGAVYKARQSSLRRTVALKTLQPAFAQDPDFIVRFHNEAIAAAALNHPNLVQVYAAGENDGVHWFVMEYVEGESAQARLERKGRIEPVEAIAIAMHVATALDHGWDRAQLIHRDIKPDNIFLSGRGEVKLGDLGLAKSAGQSQGLTLAGAAMGTPYYISPEQAKGKSDLDLRTDIYSLGCTLYHMLSGQPPYTGESSLEVMMKHVSAPVPNLCSVWPECPAELASTVGKMMQKQPGARQQSYAEVNADLRRAYDVFTGARTPRATVIDGKKRRLPVAAWAGGAVALLAAIAAFIYFAPWKNGGAHAPRTLPSPVAQETRDGARVPPSAATKEKPFVNTLGMKFVPVPGTTVLFSIWDTRVQDYEKYAKATNLRVRQVTHEQGPTHPVVSVTWEDSKAFCSWLTAQERKTGLIGLSQEYRLPTDEEWSIAVGLPKEEGATPKAKSGRIANAYPWGTSWPPPKGAGNYLGEGETPASLKNLFGSKPNYIIPEEIVGYRDGFEQTSPVGSFAANSMGLYDMGGNVFQFVEDWHDEKQDSRPLRGNSWWSAKDPRTHLLSSFRYSIPKGVMASESFGFRCVLTMSSSPKAAVITPAKSATVSPAASLGPATPDPKQASKEKPFENSLGMKFVPVPGTTVLFSIWHTRIQDWLKFERTTTRPRKPASTVASGPIHPMAFMSWEDAKAFCAWLTEEERKLGRIGPMQEYRLPMDAEWSVAVGLPVEKGNSPYERGALSTNTNVFPWGTSWPPPKGVGNYGTSLNADEFETTSPVGSFPPNPFGSGSV